jgi:probable F420-dependent oxidoreductase
MSATRLFRFASARNATATAAAYIGGVRRIGALGYAVVLIGDHFTPSWFEPGPAMAAAAMATTTLRVGCTVFANDFRHPALLAKEVASIDVLTGGRFEFGIGAGWNKREYDRVGIPFDPPAVRVARMEEAVHIIKELWSDGPCSFTGRHYTISGPDGTPKPVQRPYPPIFMGGGGKRLLSFAAREADIVGFQGRTPPGGGIPSASAPVTEEGLAEKVGWVRDAAGERFDRLELALLLQGIAVTDDRPAAAERLADAHGMTAEAVLASVHFLIGSVEHIIESRLAQRERHGISYLSVYPRDMEAFAPVVARLAGR